jgi:hypothetical protein
MALRAVVYIPAAVEVARWLPLCLTHCNREGYHVVAVIMPTVGSWRSVFEMLVRREADVCVVGSYDQLEPDRMPRIEEATNNRTRPPGERRPKVVPET